MAMHGTIEFSHGEREIKACTVSFVDLNQLILLISTSS